MKWVVGIDEVGRGALAGPVVVAAAVLPKGFRVQHAEIGKLKDSKKLSAAQREAWVEYFETQPSLSFALARVYPRQIEKQNISRAANIAAERALKRLMAAKGFNGKVGKKTAVFLDGGLFLGAKKRRGKNVQNAKTIIKGDEKITAIKIASIAAKVYRDRLMCRLAKKYPEYGFEIHKGYGTEVHRRALKKHGATKAHRLTFLKNHATIGK